MVVALAAAVLALGLVPLLSPDAAQPAGGHRGSHDGGRDDKLLFFAADGLRQDKVADYADERAVPGFRELLRKGARASGHGLLTQAPTNTGSGWFTLATGAWPGVHGSTNNTFHKNGDPFFQTATHPGRTGAFDPGVLQAETLAQAAERGGKKVAQIELPACVPMFPGGTGRFPQVSGLRITFHCDGQTPVVDSMAKALPGGPATPIGPDDTVRLVTNDFMFGGGDGYTALAGGTAVLQPGDGLLEVTIEYIDLNSPVAPVVDGRILRGP